MKSATRQPGAQYDLTNSYGVGYTPSGHIFYFDLEDYDNIKRYSWYYSNGYIQAKVPSTIQMHRLVTNCPDTHHIDHINHIKWDNRKTNLRVVTCNENMKNKSLYRRNRSGHSGVRWNEKCQKWNATIGHNKKLLWLGTFDTIEEAIQVRKEAEKKYGYISQE